MKQIKLAGKIEKRGAGRRANTTVKGERFDSLCFSLLTRKQLDARLAEAHAN